MAEFFLMPQASPTMEIGRLITWNVSEGDKLDPQDVIAEVETDKATTEIVTYDPGYVLKLLYPADSEIPVNTPIAIIGTAANEDISALVSEFETQKSSTPDTSSAKEEQPAPQAAKVKTGPAARDAAHELGVDLNSVSGTGRSGRILRKDVENAAPSPQSVPASAGVERFKWNGKNIDESIMEPLVSFQPSGNFPTRRNRGTATPSTPDEIIANNMMRKTIAKRLKASYLDAPTFFLNAKYNCDNMYSFRNTLKGLDIKVSYNDIVVKAVAKALKDIPAVNASWSEDAITRYGRVDIGVAVALPDGLITPVVRNADKKSLSAISAEIRDLAKRAQDGTLAYEEYSDSTFTISNLGMMGIEHFTAIINPPNSAILAVGSLQQEPVVDNGELSVGWRMKATMTCDHRVIDGALGATFLAAVRKYIENPMLLQDW